MRLMHDTFNILEAEYEAEARQLGQTKVSPFGLKDPHSDKVFSMGGYTVLLDEVKNKPKPKMPVKKRIGKEWR